MNLSKPLRAAWRLLFPFFIRCRRRLPRQQCSLFVSPADGRTGIVPIFVINLDRQPDRWAELYRELDRIVDGAGEPLSKRAIRYSARDARTHTGDLYDPVDIDPFYQLRDQLFVEPQPHAIPDAFDLERSIRMTSEEIAIACSHIAIWRTIAQSDAPYALVLEDDVWFERGFTRLIDQAWREMAAADGTEPAFDVLYLSYREVRRGAPKELTSKSVFRPERGLWQLSGYVLSNKGAKKLLGLLPCRGPVDLWINHKFPTLDVRALRRSVIKQRPDRNSTNSYSILPALSRIGILKDGDGSLFRQRPIHAPVFACGPPGSGLSSLAMALSMLGYRCCSDFDRIPERELEGLLSGGADCVFNAYVNIGSLNRNIRVLARRYPRAKFIVIGDRATAAGDRRDNVPSELEGSDILRLHDGNPNAWRALCEHLRVAPPGVPYPVVPDIGQRSYQRVPARTLTTRRAKWLRRDRSPWVVNPRAGWAGMGTSSSDASAPAAASPVCFEDDLADIQSGRWLLRNDTSPGNLGLFRPANVAAKPGGGLSLAVIEESLGVRELSAAAISSRGSFLFGRFEATLQAAKVPGLVTGFVLRRDSPRQEIDVAIAGHRTDRLLVNVFYNPGSEGAKFDYGDRGTPASVLLGFDASKGLHRFVIEWTPCEIRWFVDNELVHRRAIWEPTPIPHLPMTLHVNTWPARSQKLAGRLALRALPASSIVRRIAVNAFSAEAPPPWECRWDISSNSVAHPQQETATNDRLG